MARVFFGHGSWILFGWSLRMYPILPFVLVTQCQPCRRKTTVSFVPLPKECALACSLTENRIRCLRLLLNSISVSSCQCSVRDTCRKQRFWGAPFKCEGLRNRIFWLVTKTETQAQRNFHTLRDCIETCFFNACTVSWCKKEPRMFSKTFA